MIELDVRTAEPSAFLRAVWSDQVPYVTARSINLTAMDFQKAQRAHQEDIFTIRRKAFVQGAVKIKPFANKTSLSARVSIDPPGGQARANILTKFQADTQKLPFRGSRLAVPTPNVPRGASGIIPKQWRPRNLGLGSRARVFSSKGRDVVSGKRGVVAILKPGGKGMIFQREESGRLKVLYWLTPRVRIRPNLRFFQIGEQTIASRWVPNFDKTFSETMSRDRVRVGASFGAMLSTLEAF